MAGQGTDTILSQNEFNERLARLVKNVSSRVVVREETLRHVLLGLFTDGHVLLEDTPGVGKTLLAKTIAHSIDGRFARIQCTPDLLPSDITGSSIYNMKEGRFDFVPGPVFANILLADEVNRTGPRTQSALLESMAEKQVSADGVMHALPRPFMVIATQNSSESHGIFPLPDSQLDRFLISMSLGLPSAEDEVEILSREEHGASDVSHVLTSGDILAMQELVTAVSVALPVKEYIVALCRATREHPLIRRGVSPRGSVSLQRAAQGWAAFGGRGFLSPDDVKHVAPLVLAHRLLTRPGANIAPAELIREILTTVPVPL
ncbi:MAG: MoxR family ATPase [SAR202 cluster bacterium]|nr:MoxR family ATPase [SAR202 cluster bacterium]